MLGGAGQVVVQAALLAQFHHQSHLAVGRISADAIHGKDVFVGVQQQLVVQAPFVVDGGSIRTTGTVALDGHRQSALCVLREIHIAKGTLAQVARAGQVGMGHQRKPSVSTTGTVGWTCWWWTCMRCARGASGTTRRVGLRRLR
jgi:hypothetical protein